MDAPMVGTASVADTGERRFIPWVLLVGAAAVGILTSLYAIFVVAPTEAQMGIVQKIFYFHVPSAIAMYLAFAISGVSSAVFLVKRSDAWDAWAVAGAEVGVLFCAIVLTTGPLWARKAWGVWWTWDPRLTTTLLAGLVFAAYLALRAFGNSGEAERKFAAAMAVVGVADLPIIHFSVKRWRGQHPQIEGLDPDMTLAFRISLVAFMLLVFAMTWARARAERLRQRVRLAELDAAERGALEET